MENVEVEKDIGVLIHQSLKPSHQCFKAAAKANQVLGQISKSFHYRDRINWIGIYKIYVRPHLETSCQAWSPWLKKDIEVLERVQEKVVKRVIGLKGKSYEERLRELKMISLYDRRQRGDLIQIWKTLHGHSLMDSSMFQYARHNPGSTRHTAKELNLSKPFGHLDVRNNSFSVRTVDKWNKLPEQIQKAETLDIFKREYDKFVHNIIWD